MLGIPSSTDTLEAKLSTETRNILLQAVIPPCPAQVLSPRKWPHVNCSTQTTLQGRRASETIASYQRHTRSFVTNSVPDSCSKSNIYATATLRQTKKLSISACFCFKRGSATHMASSMDASGTADALHSPTTLHPSGRPVANDGISVQYNVLTK